MTLRMTQRRTTTRRRRSQWHTDGDPLSGVANLFDLGMVFAVALLVALVSHYRLPELLVQGADVTIVKNPGEPDMEIIRKRGLKLERMRMTTKEAAGEGQRLGTAYRLKSGEVVYVPERTTIVPEGRDAR